MTASGGGKAGPRWLSSSRQTGRASVIAALLLLLGLDHPPAFAQQNCLDLSLVLSVDASSSISDGEYRLQMRGAAAALRSADVQSAIREAGQVSMAVVIWSSDRTHKHYIPWGSVSTSGEADAFAARLESVKRPMLGDTGLGAGLEAALAMLESVPCSTRKVINISGDGRETPLTRYRRQSLPPAAVRDAAEASGIEINALAISNEETDLRSYFQSNVITGPDAFVIEIDSFADIKAAFRHKLVREITPRHVSSLAPRGGTVTR